MMVCQRWGNESSASWSVLLTLIIKSWLVVQFQQSPKLAFSIINDSSSSWFDLYDRTLKTFTTPKIILEEIYRGVRIHKILRSTPKYLFTSLKKRPTAGPVNKMNFDFYQLAFVALRWVELPPSWIHSTDSAHLRTRPRYPVNRCFITSGTEI